MVRIQEIQDSLLHLIGWRQSFDANDGVISAALTESESGQYYQDAHPLLTLQNLRSIAPDFSNTSYPEHSADVAYAKGTIVKKDGILYKAAKDVPAYIEIESIVDDGNYTKANLFSIQKGASHGNDILREDEIWLIDTTNSLADETGKCDAYIRGDGFTKAHELTLYKLTDYSEYWKETDPFSEWLETKTKACITKAINCYVNEKIAKGTYKTLCEKKTLFDGTGRIYDTIKNKNNLVGFEIVPIRAKGVTTKINRIGLQFSEPGDYTILVMHSSLMEPYYRETFTKRVGNNIEWFTPSQELYLPYETDEIDAGGSWYICYVQSQLPIGSQAIRKSRDWSKGPCNECSRHEYETWRIWSKYIEVHPFYVNEELVPVVDEQVQLWDVENNLYDYSTNYGLNLDITVACDMTDFIIEQRYMFTDYLSKSLAIDFLREFAYNPNVRTNRHSINASRPDILYEIDGDSSSMKKSGLSYQLELASKAIQVSTEGIDKVCLPCVNHGIKYRVV